MAAITAATASTGPAAGSAAAFVDCGIGDVAAGVDVVCCDVTVPGTVAKEPLAKEPVAAVAAGVYAGPGFVVNADVDDGVDAVVAGAAVLALVFEVDATLEPSTVAQNCCAAGTTWSMMIL